MRVKMVTDWIGTGGKIDIQPSKMMRCKTVTACLKRKMCDTGLGQGCQCCVKADAIWRGQGRQA